MNPEIEEKLIQLQRYQEKRMKPEVVPEKGRDSLSPRSPSPGGQGLRRRPPPVRRDDDDEWVDASPRKRGRARPPSPPPPAQPPRAPPAPPPRAPPSAPDERRRAATNHSRLQMLLFKHKEMLKKDIIKKRSALEKELGVEIQVCFSVL